jgi:hypothetical protein
MADDEDKLRRRALLVRSLSFPVCTIGFTLFGAWLGVLEARGRDSIFPPQLSGGLIGLVIGVVVSAVTATAIDIKWPRK